MRPRVLFLALLAAIFGLAACGVQVPADPDGTLERASGGVLVVGVSHNPPWTDVTGETVTGTEADLVRDFAQSIDAEVDWRVGGEEHVMAVQLGENAFMVELEEFLLAQDVRR